MYTKQQIIRRAAKLGSKANTLRGAIRSLRGARVHVLPLDAIATTTNRRVTAMEGYPRGGQIDTFRSDWPHPWPQDPPTANLAAPSARNDWRYNHLSDRYWTPRELWRMVQSRKRWLSRMERLAREAMDRFGLLDREQMQALYQATGSEAIVRHEAARMRRMTIARRGARLARILAAPAEADQLLHQIYDPLAIDLAKSYHAHIEHVYQSKRASIHLGQAQSRTDWDAYSKRYGYPANWVDAGVTVALDATRGPLATIHTSRNKHITLPLHRHARYDHPTLLDGDLYATERHGIIERYDSRDRKTGIALRIPAIAGEPVTYEHGRNIAECRAEYERKLQIRRDKAVALLHDTDYRTRRKARLVAHLCRNLTCTIDDARSVGYCRAGIDAFRSRHGLGEQATISQLRSTHDDRALRVVLAAAARCVRERV
jgi:hypothetical protein